MRLGRPRLLREFICPKLADAAGQGTAVRLRGSRRRVLHLFVRRAVLHALTSAGSVWRASVLQGERTKLPF